MELTGPQPEPQSNEHHRYECHHRSNIKKYQNNFILPLVNLLQQLFRFLIHDHVSVLGFIYSIFFSQFFSQNGILERGENCKSLKYMVGRAGVEPATIGLKGRPTFLLIQIVT